MASPKSKTSRSHRGARRSHKAISPISLQKCKNCKAFYKSHHVCPSCGYYNKRKVMKV